MLESAEIAKRAAIQRAMLQRTRSAEKRRQARSRLTTLLAACQSYICPRCEELLPIWEYKPSWSLCADDTGHAWVVHRCCADALTRAEPRVTMEVPTYLVPVFPADKAPLPGMTVRRSGIRINSRLEKVPDDGGGSWLPRDLERLAELQSLNRPILELARSLELKLGTVRFKTRLEEAFASTKNLQRALTIAVTATYRLSDLGVAQREVDRADSAREKFGIEDPEIVAAMQPNQPRRLKLKFYR